MQKIAEQPLWPFSDNLHFISTPMFFRYARRASFEERNVLLVREHHRKRAATPQNGKTASRVASS
jgi:hypothetical protein